MEARRMFYSTQFYDSYSSLNFVASNITHWLC